MGHSDFIGSFWGLFEERVLDELWVDILGEYLGLPILPTASDFLEISVLKTGHCEDLPDVRTSGTQHPGQSKVSSELMQSILWAWAFWWPIVDQFR